MGEQSPIGKNERNKMVKVKKEIIKTIKLQRNNKIIERPYADYRANKARYEFRGFKPVQDLVKDKDEHILEFKPKAQDDKVKKTRSRGKKKIKEDI